LSLQLRIGRGIKWTQLATAGEEILLHDPTIKQNTIKDHNSARNAKFRVNTA
jgi:hypothetical protein